MYIFCIAAKVRKGADDLIERSEKIDFQDAYDKWWADPEAEVVSCGNPEPVIEWLKGKSADDWHAIATSWNYDYGSEVLAWILEQEECDRGTAAHVFLTEAQGHWLDDALRNDPEAKKAGQFATSFLQTGLSIGHPS